MQTLHFSNFFGLNMVVSFWTVVGLSFRKSGLDLHRKG